MSSLYEDRKQILLKLGYKSYRDYLKGPIWKTIRIKVLERHRYRCWCCRSYATSVHHRRYDRKTLLGQDLTGLVAICDSCHHYIEFGRNGKKQTLEAANYRLLVIRRKNRRLTGRHKKRRSRRRNHE
jgi:hypothetical protein